MSVFGGSLGNRSREAVRSEISTGSVIGSKNHPALGSRSEMELFLIIFRWLCGLLSGGVPAAWARRSFVSFRTFCGPARWRLGHWNVPEVGWMQVRPVLEKFGIVPGRRALAVPATCPRVSLRRPCPTQSDRVLPGRLVTGCISTDPSKPSHPVRG